MPCPQVTRSHRPRGFDCMSQCESRLQATAASGTWPRRCWLALRALLWPLPAFPRPPPEPRRELESLGERFGPLPTPPRGGCLQPSLAWTELPGPSDTVLGENRNVRGHPWEGKHQVLLWQPSAGRIKPWPAETRTFAAYRTNFPAPDGAVEGTSGWGGMWTPRPGPAARRIFIFPLDQAAEE